VTRLSFWDTRNHQLVVGGLGLGTCTSNVCMWLSRSLGRWDGMGLDVCPMRVLVGHGTSNVCGLVGR
jgi:hypothetical protein